MGKNNQEKKEPKVTVTIAEVFGLLLFIFLLLVGFLIYLRFSGYSPLSSYFQKPEVSAESLTEKFNRQINQQKETGGEVEIRITETEMSEAIGVTKSDFPLKNAKLTINQSGVKVTGKSKQGIFGLNIEILAVPKAEAGELKFDIREIKAGGVLAPPQLAENYTKELNNLISSYLPSQNRINVERVSCMVGFLNLSGTKK